MYPGSTRPHAARSTAGSSTAPGRRDHVPGQPPVAGLVLPHRHRRGRHPRLGGQHGLDLAELDPEPADLDLVIGPAQVLQLPVRRSTGPGPRSGTSAAPAGPNGHATNRSAVSPGRPRYPRASCAPARYSSPATPGGTSPSPASSTNTRVFPIGRPIGTTPAGSSSPGRTQNRTHPTVASVGPYSFTTVTSGYRSRTSRSIPPGSASPPTTRSPSAAHPATRPSNGR